MSAFDDVRLSANYTSARPPSGYKFHDEVKAEPVKHYQDDFHSSPEVSREATYDEDGNSPIFLPPTPIWTEESNFISRKRKSDSVITNICKESYDKHSKAKSKKKHKCTMHPEGETYDGLFNDHPGPCDTVTCDFYMSPKSKNKYLKESPARKKAGTKSAVSSYGSSCGTERSRSRQFIKSISPVSEQSSTPTGKAFSFKPKSFYGGQPKKKLTNYYGDNGSSEEDIFDSPPKPATPLLVTVEAIDSEEEKKRHSVVPVKEKILTTRPPIQTRNYQIGLPNYGNTCYVNATLQVLLSLDGFTRDLNAACQEVTYQLPFCVHELNQMAIARNDASFTRVHEILESYIERLGELNVQYKGNKQHDANEFFVRLLEKTRSSLPSGPDKNPVEKHFQCELVQMHLCSKCGAVDTLPQNSTSICLPITDASSDLVQCLKDYTSAEERPIVCPSCESPSMIVQTRFRTLPQVLVMSLNRYSKVGKMTKIITAPPDLHMRPYTTDSENTIYSLCAKISHVGESKDSGHYVSHILCDDGSWRRYSDNMIEVLASDEPQVEKRDPAYIYFYGKVI